MKLQMLRPGITLGKNVGRAGTLDGGQGPRDRIQIEPGSMKLQMLHFSIILAKHVGRFGFRRGPRNHIQILPGSTKLQCRTPIAFWAQIQGGTQLSELSVCTLKLQIPGTRRSGTAAVEATPCTPRAEWRSG